MAINDETYAIVLKIEGEERLRKLSDEVAKEEAALRKLAQQAAATGQSQTAFAAQAEAHAQRIAGLNKQINETHAMMAKAGVGARGAGQAIQQLGYVVDDVQYGFKGIANNISPLLTSLGAGAGLAGTVAIASIAMTQLYEHADDIARLFGMGGTESEADRMERLEKATGRTAEETATLTKYKRELAAVEAQRASVSRAERQQTSIVNDAIAELGHSETVKGLAAINRQRYEQSPENADLVQRRDAKAESAQRLRNQGQGAAAALAERQLAAIEGQLNRSVMQMAERDLGRAATDPGFLQGFANRIIENPGAFGPNGMKFAAQLMAAMPENQAAEAGNRALGAKQEGQAGRRAAEDQAAARAEARALINDQREQQRRAREQAQDLRDRGGMDPVRAAMLGVFNQGGSEGQIEARGVRMLMDQGLSIEEAQKQARSMMKEKIGDQGGGLAARLKELAGPRQLFDSASAFKNAVMTSGGENDPMRQQLEESKKARSVLERIDQTLQSRTFPSVVQ